MAKPRMALVGLGMGVTPHAKSLLELRERVEVAYAFSPTAARREAFAARFPFPLCDRLETILEDPTIDAVCVVTPPNTHLEIAQRCAAAGKHVLLEKPVEITTERAMAVVETCRRANVVLGIVLQHRFRPAGMRLGELLRSGALGPIVGCSTTVRLWRPQAYYDEPGRGTRARDGGGVLITQAIHTLDLMLSLAGPVEQVCGYVATTPIHRMESEDQVCAAVRFENGALGTIDASAAAYPGFPERIDVTCTEATATLTGTALEVFHHDGRRTSVAPHVPAGGTGADPMAFPHDDHRALLADFLDAIGSGRPPRISGEEALRVHRLIDALLAAGATGGSAQVAAA